MRKESWRSAAHIRLAESEAAGMTALDNLEKIHSAYRKAIPLLNYSATPSGRYDSFYLRALFKEDQNESSTYDTARASLHDYIQLIQVLINMSNCSDEDVDQNYLNNHTSYIYRLKGRFDVYTRQLQEYKEYITERPLNLIEGFKDEYGADIQLLDAVVPNLKLGIEYLRFFGDDLSEVTRVVKGNHNTELLRLYMENFERQMPASMMQMVDSDDGFYGFTVPRIHKIYEDALYKVREFKRNIDTGQDNICSLMARAAADPSFTDVFNGMDEDFYEHYFKQPGCDGDGKQRPCVTEATNYVKMIMLQRKITCDEHNGTRGSIDRTMDDLRKSGVTKLQNKLKTLREQKQLNGDFHSRNFVKLNIYMRDLRVKTFEQQIGYTIIGMLGDIGGSMGMYIGASIITLFEAFDIVLLALARRRRKKTDHGTPPVEDHLA
ncbi:hypothetical protein NP493_101g09066 [Ridgeia piscesae]|uniref:Uncharacterized protein n=1 Tax=Ridgeia piscesae TaxID=27915 RepID=A0AAD9UHE4_RIDPI|nr:hypothetical protein NP493_101g09066 [Ridgeia piscesae]